MLRDYIRLHFIVFLWGFTAILGALITVPAIEVVFYRTLFASTVLGLWLYRSQLSFRLPAKKLIPIFLTGMVVGAHWITFFASVKISGASIALAGLSTTTLWTALFDPIFQKRKISRLEVALSFVVIAGLYLVFRFQFNHAVGLSIALVSAFLAAVFTILNGKFIKSTHQLSITFLEMAGACAFCVLFLPIYTAFWAQDGQMHLALSLSDFFWLLLLGIGCTVYPYVACVELLKRLSVFTTTLSITMEPIYGMILAALLLGEHDKLNLGFYSGAGVIMSSVILYPILKRKLPNAKQP